MELKSSLIFMGLKHCGKSTLGKLAAKHWGMTFKDLDDLLLELARERITPKPDNCRDIYQKDPEEFRFYETSAAKKAGEEMDKTPFILSLGGGTIENLKALEGLESANSSKLWIYLKEEEQILFNRIAAGGIPPFLNRDRPRDSWHEIYERREKLYEKKASIILDLKGANPAKTLEMLDESLRGNRI